MGNQSHSYFNILRCLASSASFKRSIAWIWMYAVHWMPSVPAPTEFFEEGENGSDEREDKCILEKICVVEIRNVEAVTHVIEVD